MCQQLKLLSILYSFLVRLSILENMMQQSMSDIYKPNFNIITCSIALHELVTSNGQEVIESAITYCSGEKMFV